MSKKQAITANALAATSQPLAVEAALGVLQSGGNAVDAAVCAAALLGVVEPMSTGIGGDCFAIVYEAKTGALHGINGSGRTPRSASIEGLKKAGHSAMPQSGILSVSVPGALHAWDQLLVKLGTKPLSELLQPSIKAARDGFSVTAVIGRDWARQQSELENGVNSDVYLPDGRPPNVGERFCQPDLAKSLEAVADQGIRAFYDGDLTEAIVSQSKRLNGWFVHEDFAAHASEWVDPIATSYRGYDVFELPPNGQGIVTLEALNLLEQFELAAMDDVTRKHTQLEALKLAFADAWRYVADPAFVDVPIEGLLSKAYAKERRMQIGDRANQSPSHGFPNSGTVYVTVVDRHGNCCSLINSVYMHFGSKVVVDGTGIVLQNRAALCSFDPSHPNALAGGKRPYHTIIPAMVCKDGKPWLCFGVVGGFMQPQAQVQILNNLIDFNMSVADAVNAPRARWHNHAQITLEDGISSETRHGLARRGHEVLEPGGFGGFGGAQAILIDAQTGALHGASDPRKDGVALGY